MVAGQQDIAGGHANRVGIVTTFHALLRIARIKGGSPRARFAPVDLGASASTLADVSEPAAEEIGQTLTLSLHRPAKISGDRTLLGLALSNLIDNALRNSPHGPLSISVSSAALALADHGPGNSPGLSITADFPFPEAT